ncbi:hypothetical protein CIW83_09580 [Tissierella sp. P1]|uniref:pyocin knob domain-containing protein n=1 Tax=Tissierella sp. P1 TaxID=1280483 RepID=UPI000BA03E14|nr:pyocin knob domain-containing protein [Tissierella sp. P1]OZV12337.1 hypothetical protein CIW83_09580 [Tissierella sp. P1]
MSDGLITRQELSQTLKDELDNKLDNSMIVNNLDETEIGKALDATQGKVLNGKINNLFSKGNLGSVDFNMLTGEGYLGIALGTSENNAPTNGSYYYIVNLKYNRGGGDNDNIKQIAWGYSDNVLFTRHRYNNNWTSWTEQISSLGGNFTGEVNHGYNLVTNPSLKAYRENAIVLDGISPIINILQGNMFIHTITGNTEYMIPSNQDISYVDSFTLTIIQESTPKSIAFPSNVVWVNGIPDLTKANTEYIITFISSSKVANRWIAMFGGGVSVS